MLVTNSLSANMSSSTPDSSAKKMKQMRLPFGKIDRNSALAKMETEVKKGEEESKKRKASTSSTEGSETGGKEEAAAKVKVKIGSAKKKAKTEIKENEVIVLSDDESEVAKDKKKATVEVKATIEETKPANMEPEIIAVDKSDDDKAQTENQLQFTEGEKILCFSGPLIYEAKILKGDTEDNKYFIHYHGWNKSWDEWVDKTQMLKHTELNLEKKRDLDKAHESEDAEIVEIPVGDNKSTPKDSDPETAPDVFKTPEPSMKRKSESTPEVSSEKLKKLTPKQIAHKEKLEKQRKEKEAKKEAEKQAKEAERQKEKDRKEAEKQKEKERKEAERKAKEAQKEAERKEKEALKEAERLEKEKLKQEKETEKLKEKERKEAEKKAKEAQKEAERLEKEEQARKKQEEKDEKEKAEKAKAEKAKMSFASFFVKKQKAASEPSEPQKENSIFTQFQVKSNMKVAPILRGLIANDFELNTGVPIEELYLNKLSKGHFKPGKQSRTWPYASKVDDEIEILEDEEDEDDIGEEILNESLIKPSEKKVFKKAKLLQFHDNQRPAYFGTWTKKEEKISGRTPFGKFADFDYEYDSDDDWEEEEQGESLSDEEKDQEEDEKEDEKLDEDDDDGFFVGHGVLDKDELRNDDDEDDEAFDEELEMKKQKLKAQQFEEEYKKKKPTKLKPRVFGCFWNDPAHAHDKDDQVRINHESFIKILNPFKAVVLQQIGLIQTSLSKPKVEEKESPSTAEAPKAKVLKEFPESAMLDLIKLVHANTNKKPFLAREFVEYWSSKNSGTKLSQQLTLKKLQEIADYQKQERCWKVKDDVLKTFNVMEPEIPNKWEYLLEVPKKAANATPSIATPSTTPSTSTSATPSKREEVDVNATPKTSSPKSKISDAAKTPKTSSTPKVSKPSPSILMFAKKLTKAEQDEQRLKVIRESKPKPAPAPTPKAPVKQQPTIIDLTQN